MQPSSLRILNRPRPGSRPAQVTKLDALPVKVGEQEEPSPALRGPVRRVCLVCKANNSAYACPRCSIPYCSSACYKSHGQKCTEQFFRHHVEGEMRLREAERKEEGGGKDRRTVVEALRKWKGGEGSVGEEYLAEDRPENEVDENRLELLAKLGEGGALGLEVLSEEERRRFLADVASGEVGRALQVWKPWWLVPMGSGAAPLVSVVSQPGPSGGNQGENAEADLPEGCVTLSPLLSQVQRFDASAVPGVARGSPLLRYHILDVLLAYAHVARVTNGCWRDDPLQACEDLLSLSAVLGPRPCPLQSAAEALTGASVSLRALHPQAPIRSLVSALAKDAVVMASSGVKVQCALVDTFNIVRAALDEVQGHKDAVADEAGFDVDSLAKQIEALSVKGSKGSGEKKVEKQSGNEPAEGHASQARGSKKSKAETKQLTRLLKVLHKLRFFLAWAKRHQDGDGDETWKKLAGEAETELHVLEQQSANVVEKKSLESRPVPQVVPNAARPPASTKRVLIEELDSQPIN